MQNILLAGSTGYLGMYIAREQRWDLSKIRNKRELNPCNIHKLFLLFVSAFDHFDACVLKYAPDVINVWAVRTLYHAGAEMDHIRLGTFDFSDQVANPSSGAASAGEIGNYLSIFVIIRKTGFSTVKSRKTSGSWTNFRNGFTSDNCNFCRFCFVYHFDHTLF